MTHTMIFAIEIAGKTAIWRWQSGFARFTFKSRPSDLK
jgi:hypothetical protein